MCHLLLIGASQSELHPSDVNGDFFLSLSIYIIQSVDSVSRDGPDVTYT